MALHIEGQWHQPLELELDQTEELTYWCPKIDSVPHAWGVYVFGRWFGNNAIPLYIGRSTDIRARLEQHLNSSVKLMNAIRKAPAGGRFFLYCTLKGNFLKRLKTLESALITHALDALDDGHELLNKQGVKKPNHTVEFKTNNWTSLRLVPRRVRLQA